MATAVAHFPGSLDAGPLQRARRPLVAIAALLLVVDFMALGLHLVDSVESPFAGDDPSPARARVGAPEAVVPGSAVAGADTARRATRAAQPLGCLALDSGCYPAGTVVAPDPSSPGTATPPPTTPGNTPAAPTPVAQADLAVPALGTQVSLGLGDGGCTSLQLTVLAVGDCAAASGDGAVIVNLGGSLLGD